MIFYGHICLSPLSFFSVAETNTIYSPIHSIQLKTMTGLLLCALRRSENSTARLSIRPLP